MREILSRVFTRDFRTELLKDARKAISIVWYFLLGGLVWRIIEWLIKVL